MSARSLSGPQLRAIAKLLAAETRACKIGPHTDYQGHPYEWITTSLGVAPESLEWGLNDGYEGRKWDGTHEPLLAIMDGLVAGEDVGVESGTGTGKSFVAACLVLWFLACHEGARVYTYAPKEKQLRLYMWAEISKLWPHFEAMFPAAKMSDLRIRMDGRTDAWAAHGYAVKIRAGEESATGAQGAHAEHMLLITEETPGVDSSVMTAIENTKTAPHNLQLALGNPDNQHDELHRFCMKPRVRHIRISALDHPNVVTGEQIVPGATGRKSVEERLELYGSDNRLYRSRVKGISPAEAADALIKQAWLDEAVVRFTNPEYRKGERALGVDVADSEEGDKAAIARWMGACLMEVSDFQCHDPVALGLQVGAEMKADSIDPRHVGVDSVGVGSGTANRLKEMGLMIRALSSGAKAYPMLDKEAKARTGKGVVKTEEFGNLRSQMWWQLRRDLQEGKVAVCDDQELFEDLTTPTWFTRNGKIFVEPKEELVKRLGRSPNKGDAAVYGNWVRDRPKFKKPPEPKPDPNIDTRLERVMARLEKEQNRGFRGRRPYG